MESAVKTRTSSMDDVPTGQPSLALAQKVIERVTAAGLPSDLIPSELISVTLSPGVDVENALRSATLEFMDTVRKVEHVIAASRRPEDVPEVLDIAHLGSVSAEEWRAHWPGLAFEDVKDDAGEAVAENVEVEADDAEADDAEAAARTD